MTLEESIDNFTSEIQHLHGVPEALVLIIAPIAWGKTALIQTIIDKVEFFRDPDKYTRVEIADGRALDTAAEKADFLIVARTGLG